MEIDEIAAGEWPGAPTWHELEVWAMRSAVHIDMQYAPWVSQGHPEGMYAVNIYGPARHGEGACHPTLKGALYLLYEILHRNT